MAARAQLGIRLSIALACWAGASPSYAQDGARRVVLVSPGAELEQAARAALEPWSVQLTVVAGPSPGATAPFANEAARAIAEANHAGAVVWVSQHDAGYALWVFDLASHRVTERALGTGPPFDEATAAAVALSVKTLLRHSAVAPEAERFGAAGVEEEEVGEPAAEGSGESGHEQEHEHEHDS